MTPDEDVRLALEELRGGRVVIIPTDTVYGLAVDPTNPGAVEALFALKGRVESNPIPLLVDSVETARRCAGDWPQEAERLARAFWPGALTIVVQSDVGIDERVRGGGATVGVRQPDLDGVLALLCDFGGPLACTSANLSGRPPAKDLEELSVFFPEVYRFGVSEKPSPGALASTVVDVSDKSGVRVVRQGLITQTQVKEALAERGG